jgi:hypothetical protein
VLAPWTIDRDAGDTATVKSGEGGVDGPMAAVMSAWIAVAVSARLYTRTSSIRPLKYCPNGALPPMRSGADEVSIDPVSARDTACTPLTYTRKVAPSYVAARCVHVFNGIDVPVMPMSLPPAGCRNPMALPLPSVPKA